MVVRTRLRSIVLPIVLYLVLGVASGYLVWGASNGEHGLKAAEKFDAEASSSRRSSWDSRMNTRAGRCASRASARKASTRISWMRRRTRLLDRVGKDEVVISPAPPRAAELCAQGAPTATKAQSTFSWINAYSPTAEILVT